MLIIWAATRPGSPSGAVWILALGVWNDGGEWIDTDVWID